MQIKANKTGEAAYLQKLFPLQICGSARHFSLRQAGAISADLHACSAATLAPTVVATN